jgi:hypothetical protein
MMVYNAQNQRVCGLGHRPEFLILENITFLKLELFPSSSEGRDSVEPLTVIEVSSF